MQNLLVLNIEVKAVSATKLPLCILPFTSFFHQFIHFKNKQNLLPSCPMKSLHEYGRLAILQGEKQTLALPPCYQIHKLNKWCFFIAYSALG